MRLPSSLNTFIDNGLCICVRLYYQRCTDLFAEEILVETGVNVKSSGAGRKKVLLDINYEASYICAMTIEPEYTTVAITDLRGQVAAKKRCKTNTSITPQAYLDKLSQTAEKLLQECGTGDCRLAAIGVVSQVLWTRRPEAVLRHMASGMSRCR